MLKNVMKKNKKFLFISIILGIAAGLCALLVPFAGNKVFSNIKNIDKNSIYFMFFLIALSYLLQIFLVIFKEHMVVAVNSKNMHEFLEKLFHVNYDTMIEEGNNQLIDKVGDLVYNIYQFLMNDLNTFITSLLIVTGSLIFVFRENVVYGFMVLSLIPITYFGFKMINKELQKRSMNLQNVTSKNFQDIMSIYESPDLIKQCSDFTGISNLLKKRIRDIYLAHEDINRFAGASSMAIGMFDDFIQNIILISISYNVATGKAEVGSLVVFTLVMSLFFDSLHGLNRVNVSFSNLKASSAIYNTDVLETQEIPKSIEPKEIEEIAISNPHVKVGENDFSYPLDYKFKKGDIIYVDGKSGSGKSTLLRTLLNIRESSGIYIDGEPLNNLDYSKLRERIAYVMQQSAIIPGSLRENILLDTEISEDLDKKISSLKILKPIFKSKNLDSEIFRNGENLSGGEKQRVQIARALIKDADVYIFDEITSNLDEESQEDFFKDFIKDVSGKIVFIISHDEKVRQYTTRTINI